MPAVNLRHIEIFHAVMTTGNLTEAARMLHTSQPTVSRELARFEKVLGLKLFERARGRLQPTVQGLRLFEEVQRSWYGLDRIVSAAESLREFRQGELSVACLPVFSQSFLPLLLQPCCHRITRWPLKPNSPPPISTVKTISACRAPTATASFLIRCLWSTR